MKSVVAYIPVRNQTLSDTTHAIPCEQANHAFLSLTADTYGKLSDDFVRFLWMLANSASTNSRLSQPLSQDFADLSPDSFAAQVGSSFLHIQVRVGAAVAKAAAARFMPDSADDGLPVPVFWNKPTAYKPSTTYDLPLYHKPCWCVACVSVCMRVFCNNFCSVCVSIHLCSLVYSLLFELYDFVPSIHSSV
jgi:hypothetical protein